MRPIAIVFCLALLPSSTHADHIGLYDDPVNLCWASTPPVATLFTVYVIDRFSTGSTSAAYRVQAALPPGVLLLSGADLTCPGICINPQDPFAGAYTIPRACSTEDWPIYRFTFMHFGLDGSCYQLRIVAHPDFATPVTYDCNANPAPATGGRFSIMQYHEQCDDCTVGTESTTWGAVKALYR